MRTRTGAPPLFHGVAAALLAEITPRARLGVAISGADGAGKSALLDGIETRYRSLGIDVRRGADELPVEITPTPLTVLVDDAHELGEETLSRLRGLAAASELNLFVAYRPWPVSHGLRAVATTLEQRHEPVVLGPLGRDEVLARLQLEPGIRVSAPLVDELLEVTGGVPRFVNRVLEAGDARRVGELVPREVVEQLGRELRGVGSDLSELLLGLAIGADLAEWVPRDLRAPDVDVDELLLRAESAGFVLPDGHLVPLIKRALLESTPAHHLRALQHDLVDTLAAGGHALDDVARDLARQGLADPRVAASLARAGDQVLPSDPTQAADLYAAGTAAGLDDVGVAARRAQAKLVSGDLDGAGRIVDDLLSRDEVPDVRRAVDVAAAVWAERGMLARSADAYRWLGPTRLGSSAPLAAVALFGSGDREGAESLLTSAAAAGAPTVGRVALAAMAQGVRESLAGTGEHALATLVRASDLMTASGAAVPLPDTPASLAASVALQTGELGVARSVLDAAIASRQGGDIAQARLLLLRAWVAMRADRPEQTEVEIALARTEVLTPRDEVMLRALEVGLARRADDVPALVRSWRRARESLLHVSVDLFDLLPLGEFVVAAARLRELPRLDAALGEAWALLARLGDPPLWSVPLHWASIQAGILADTPRALAPHAAALVAAGRHSRLASVLASAGREWVAVLGGEVEVARVEVSARALASVGMTWDGYRLAAHAAAHCEDRRDMARLLACARELHRPVRQHAPAEQRPAETPRTPPQRAVAEVELSAREREVARLMLAGKNYREIGETIFISPRTVEHHVARIRQRLDIQSRSELLAHLRDALGAGDEAVR
jgi:DNA-binding CsgD family transcriptional regulator